MSHTASLWHEISSQEKKLGEQMIPIIRKPTVLITIPRTTTARPTRVLPRHAPPSPVPSPWRCRSKGDASPPAHFTPRSISPALSLLPFLFASPCFFFFFLIRARGPLRSTSSWGTSHAPKIVIFMGNLSCSQNCDTHRV